MFDIGLHTEQRSQEISLVDLARRQFHNLNSSAPRPFFDFGRRTGARSRLSDSTPNPAEDVANLIRIKGPIRPFLRKKSLD